jgi:formylglycine-generating enzyme required for sulfatase activity
MKVDMMVQRFSAVLLVLMVIFVGCGGDESNKNKDAGSADQAEGKMNKITKDSPGKIIWEKDGAKMVLIPEVVLREKDTYDEFGGLVPGKVVKVLDTFYMDTTEVTVGQFKGFLKSSGYKPEEPIDWERLYIYSPTEDHPMIWVTLDSANAYAKWAGKRLPAEAEWEFAARGGLVGKEYPWGGLDLPRDDSPAREYANFKDTGGRDKWIALAPVGSFKPNGYGLYDMSGNVQERCASGHSLF